MLQRHFGVLSSAEDWKNRTGRFIGSANRKETDAVLEPTRTANWDAVKTKRSGSCPSRNFTGKKWDDLLVIPYWDLPGRICAFLFIGRDGKMHQDVKYKSLIHGSDEAGLAMLPALMDGRHSHFGHTKFIMCDLDVAIRFHARHGRERSRPLPLAATWDDGEHTTSAVWSWFTAQHLVFWGTDRLKTIGQARRANGRVSLLVITATELETNMRNYSPEEWLDRMKAEAVPWEVALQRHLKTLDDAGVDDALSTLKLRGRELDEFIQCCRQELQERLRFINSNKTYAIREIFEGKGVLQKSNGWFLERGGECISNAVVVIEQVLTTLDHKSYYRGHVKFDGNIYPFLEKSSTLDRGMLNWVHAYLRDRCRAGIAEFYPSWNKKSIRLATLFSKPHYARGVEVIGWDAVNRQFNFPQFAIGVGGKIAKDFSCLFDNIRVPARELIAPAVFPRQHLADLGDRNDETQIFWAVTACVAANIIAEAVNRNQLPIILSGDGAIGIGNPAALRLGCVPLMDDTDRIPPSLLPEHHWNSGWPSLVRYPAASVIFTWFEQTQARRCIFSLTALAGDVMALRGVANIIRQPRKLGSLQLLQHAAAYVLPHYLQDLYSRGLFLPGEKPDLATDVLYDIAGWFGRNGGNRDAVEMAIQILHTPRERSASDHFCNMVFQLNRDGKFPYVRSDFNTIDAASTIVEIEKQGRCVWVSQDRFSDIVRAGCGLAPDLLLITKALQDQGVLLSEPALEQVRGWLLPYDWWNQQLSKWRSHAGDRLV